jgi:hypothetical protein
MTEAEWLACTDPKPMLDFLQRQASERALRLFACACVRRAWHLLTDTGRHAVEAAEAYADGVLDGEALQTASSAAHKPVDEEIEAANISWHGFSLSPPLSAAEGASQASYSMGSDITRHLAPLLAARAAQDALGAGGSECATQAALLRDLFVPLPFRPVTLDPAWRTPQIVALAQAASDQRELPAGTLDATRLAVLADALEDAGCTNAGLTEHLYSTGPHVRGCWVIDLLLGKE